MPCGGSRSTPSPGRWLGALLDSRPDEWTDDDGDEDDLDFEDEPASVPPPSPAANLSRSPLLLDDLASANSTQGFTTRSRARFVARSRIPISTKNR